MLKLVNLIYFRCFCSIVNNSTAADAATTTDVTSPNQCVYVSLLHKYILSIFDVQFVQCFNVVATPRFHSSYFSCTDGVGDVRVVLLQSQTAQNLTKLQTSNEFSL